MLVTFPEEFQTHSPLVNFVSSTDFAIFCYVCWSSIHPKDLLWDLCQVFVQASHNYSLWPSGHGSSEVMYILEHVGRKNNDPGFAALGLLPDSYILLY